MCGQAVTVVLIKNASAATLRNHRGQSIKRIDMKAKITSFNNKHLLVSIGAYRHFRHAVREMSLFWLHIKAML